MQSKLQTLAILFFVMQLNLKAQDKPTLIKAFPNLSFTQPLFLTHANDGSNRLFVVQQNGFIKVFENSPNVMVAETFLDVSNRITTDNEMGLLGLAFHPNFAENDSFYINYTDGFGSQRKTFVARYTVTPGMPNVADPNSERILFELSQPFTNHNGGMLAFGPDDYLYIGLGDGGSAGDPQENGQDPTTLLGSILRIDVDNTSNGLAYGIPQDNPFTGNTDNFREEIFAWGFRNPWRFSFDSVTGQLWAGDVGQNRVEEIDLVENGKNYGWRIMEGSECYNPNNSRDPLPNCDQTGLTLPIVEYVRNSGRASITGGYVYRGQARPELVGAYIYGDFETGDIWLLHYENGAVTADSLLLETDLLISTFGIDDKNELYIIDYIGDIYKFEPNPATSIEDKNTTIPNRIELAQNYPNPFNPNTTIQFELPQQMNVTLKVYDLRGRKVSVLVDRKMDEGKHQITFNAENLASGIYFYRLESAAGFVQTKKLTLLK